MLGSYLIQLDYLLRLFIAAVLDLKVVIRVAEGFDTPKLVAT